MLVINEIANAQRGCGHKYVTEFYPANTETLYVSTNTVKFQNGTTGHLESMRPEITREWWESWFCAKKPKVHLDYWGCEECCDTETGFIVLGKKKTSVVLFNLGGVPYAIFNAKILAYQHYYKQTLNPDAFRPHSSCIRDNKIKYFQSLKTVFGSEVVKLTTKNLENYFK